MKKFLAIITVTILAANINAQSSSTGLFTLFPDNRVHLPFKANMLEPKFGLRFRPENSQLKIDIGNSIDVLRLQTSEKASINMFAEFFAYADISEYAEYRLQVTAIDGFFGGGFIYTHYGANSRFQHRFRILHHSAHLVDGNYDTVTDTWKDGKEPMAYAKDFLEIINSWEPQLDNHTLRLYAGADFTYQLRPANQAKWAVTAGGEFTFLEALGYISEKPLHLFAAYNFRLEGVPEYSGTNHFMGGIKIGEYDSRGLVLYASWYAGNNFYGEYYDEKISNFGIGFMIDY